MEKSHHAFKVLSFQEYAHEQHEEQYSTYFVIIRTFSILRIRVGTQEYEVSENKQVFIHPNKHFRLIGAENSWGFILSFTPSFYEKSGSDSYLLHSELFFNAEKDLQITNSAHTEADFTHFVINRLNRCPKEDICLYTSLAHNCIEYLLLDGLLWLQYRPVRVSETAFSPHRMVNAFLVLLNKHCKEKTQVTDYADILHITPRKLSALCQNVLGKPAKQIISEAVVSLALRYIRTTDLSISQIAYEMGFTDDGNFRRFIKQHTGAAPLTFRHRTPSGRQL